MALKKLMKKFTFFLTLIFLNGCESGKEKNKITYSPEFSPYVQNIPDSDVNIEFMPVPGGTFMMGNSEDATNGKENEGPQRKVKVDSFWMGAYEITWEQYDQFLNETSDLNNLKLSLDNGTEIEIDAVSSATPMYMDMSFGMGRDGYPAVNMTQYAAVMFSKWLFAKTGEFYRLPTEAEWEYACRAGTTTAFYFGDNPDELNEYAWFSSNSENAYKKVGLKKPNAFGLYDMHGNVAEWTMDEYLEDYHEQLKGRVADNPYFLPTKLYPRSVRGGSWMDDGENLGCTKRRGSSKQWKKRDPQIPKSLWWLTDAPFVGFRLIRPKKMPSKEEIEKYWIEAIEDYS